MTARLRIALAQTNSIVGDIKANLVRASEILAAARDADLLVFPELFICGYPPEDLVLRSSFINACYMAVNELAKLTSGIRTAIIIGAPMADPDDRTKVYNSAFILADGRVTNVHHKIDLPNYGVFDEKRVFTPGLEPLCFNLYGVKIGVAICEDIWEPMVSAKLKQLGADIIISPNGSPYWRDKHAIRNQIARQRVAETGLPLVYVNQIGGQDELVFDGASFALDSKGSTVLQLPYFEQKLACCEFIKNGHIISNESSLIKEYTEIDHLRADWQACVLGLRDYVNKAGFPGVILGLSGGIDSAVCAAIAVDALGAERVNCVMMPYIYTAPDSIDNAIECSQKLGIKYRQIAINEMMASFKRQMPKELTSDDDKLTSKTGVALQNLQSRIRGNILMAISNASGYMLISTGNKSEMALGYATIYGDMNGGFNPIKDIYKTDVYKLANWRNNNCFNWLKGPGGVVIPEAIISKPPSAELAPDQTDQDTLPPYDTLDAILELLVDNDMDVKAIAKRGYDPAVISKIENMLYLAEYKRRQAPPGVRITRRNFGKGRRYPIINGFRASRY